MTEERSHAAALASLRDTLAKHHERRPHGKVMLVPVGELEALLAALDQARQLARTYWGWVEGRYRPHAPWYEWLDDAPSTSPTVPFLTWDGARDADGRGIVDVQFAYRELDVLCPAGIVTIQTPAGPTDVFIYRVEVTDAEAMEHLRVTFLPLAETQRWGAR